jgi:hypothetical protein
VQVCVFYLVLRALDTVGEHQPSPAFEFVLPRLVEIRTLFERLSVKFISAFREQRSLCLLL